MALAATGLALASAAGDRRARLPRSAEEAAPRRRALNPGVRDLVGAILERTEDYDSLRLRAQLAVAVEEVWGEDDGEASRFLELSVPDDVPLAVPHTFTFPVSARFTSPRGVPCVVQLLVERGRLRSVLLDVSAEEWAAVGGQWMERTEAAGGDPDPLADVAGWPAPSEVTFVVEQSGRP